MSESELSFDDIVYEDDYYDENYESEEIQDSEELALGEQDSSQSSRSAILLCEECDNRWEDDIDPDNEPDLIFCPMCGSKKIIEL